MQLARIVRMLAAMGIFDSDATTAQSGHLNVIAILIAKKGHEAEVRAMLEALVAQTRGQEGCMSYHLHVDMKDSSSFYTYEQWENAGLLEAHLEAAKPLIASMMDLLAGVPRITVLDHLV